MDSLFIDCRSCPVRGRHCGDCVVPTLFLQATPELPLDAGERQAVGVFAAAGLLDAAQVAGLRARAEPWHDALAVG